MPGLGLGLRTAVLTRFPAQKYKKYERHFGLAFLCWGLQSDCVLHCILAIVDPMRIDSVSRAENAIHCLESQGLLLNVFNHLEGLNDFIRCTCVSKSWRAIVEQARPLSLVIGGSSFPMLDYDGVTGVLRWLQTKQRQGHLQNLQNFCLEGKTLFLSEYVDEPKTHSALFEASIMSAGVWNLRTCTLEGPFCLETAASLLPTTLQQLTLTVYEPPEVSYLSWLERFVGLQLLYLSGLPDWPGEEQPLVMFEVDGTMPSLRELIMSTPFCCTDTAQVNLHLCLPSICHLYVLVLGDPHVARLVQGFFELSHLTYLNLCILDGTLPWIVVVVPRASSVSTLRLVGHKKPVVSLEIKERDFAFECRGVPNISMPRPNISMSRLKLV